MEATRKRKNKIKKEKRDWKNEKYIILKIEIINATATVHRKTIH